MLGDQIPPINLDKKLFTIIIGTCFRVLPSGSVVRFICDGV